jgi:hypothetical protein
MSKSHRPCDCPVCRLDRDETVLRHDRMRAGLRRLVIGQAGPAVSPQKDGLVCVYGPDLDEEGVL